ncbi:hypothetical protein BC937DRAFT_93108 [Endogone sp. FLAS-F59071]|nr:hypothetical protein BC937DRAFT_93108 [Endogone sp. FLAS-F59071]|eukprot:RUS21283.1 hypothetical protein BC937DRAFT_93108 [Endogone sp. FLAS-F59071]
MDNELELMSGLLFSYRILQYPEPGTNVGNVEFYSLPSLCNKEALSLYYPTPMPIKKRSTNIPKKNVRIALGQILPLNPTDENDQEFLQYLTDEASGSVKKGNDLTAASLSDSIGFMLIDFGYCETQEQVQETCEQIASAWDTIVHPPPPPPPEDDKDLEDEEEDEEEEAADAVTHAGDCEMCLRPMPLTFHHLIPKMTHKKMVKRGVVTKEEALTRGAYLCRPCHSAVHRTFPHMELALHYDTVEKLMKDEKIQKWVQYAEKQRVVAKNHIKNGLRYRRRFPSISVLLF